MAITSGYIPHEYVHKPTNIPQIPSVHAHPQTSSRPSVGQNTNVSSSPSQALPRPEEQKEASSVSNDDTLQDEVIHDKTGKTSIRQNKVPTVRKKVTKDTIQIRDFPRDVMDIIRGIVPGGNSYVETLLAYIYVTSPVKFDIPSNVQDIVDGYMQDDQLTQVFKEIRLLREQMRNVEMSSYQSALASECTLFNELGLRKDTEKNPSDINYLEPGVEDMHIALEDYAKQLKKKDTIRHGRR